MQRPDERFYPKDFAIPFIFHARHYERYLTALKLLEKLGQGEIWLDCACGSGYGTKFLSNFVTNIRGYDINKEVISYAEQHYSVEGCAFCNYLNKKIKFDVIFSIETIEHIERNKASEFLNSLHSTMKDNGLLILSTPVVKVSNPNPANSFHQHEYCLKELSVLLLDNKFKVVEEVLQKTKFTDGEVKEQGFFKCVRLK